MSKEPTLEEMSLSSSNFGLEEAKKKEAEPEKKKEKISSFAKTVTLPPPTKSYSEIPKTGNTKDEKEREVLYNKIHNIFKDPILKKKLEGLKPPSEKATLADLRLLYAQIQSALGQESKKRFVYQTFDLFCSGTEDFFIKFMKDPTKHGLGNFLSARKEDMLEQDLAEITAELPNDWIPSAKVRLFMTMATLAMTYDVRNFSKVEEQEEKNNKV